MQEFTIDIKTALTIITTDETIAKEFTTGITTAFTDVKDFLSDIATAVTDFRTDQADIKVFESDHRARDGLCAAARRYLLWQVCSKSPEDTYSLPTEPDGAYIQGM